MIFKEKIEHLIESGFQIVYIPTGERSRCEEELKAVADKLKMGFITWDGVSGLSTEPALKDPLEMLVALSEEADNKNNKKNTRWKKQDVMFVMRNLHNFLEDPGVRQALQNMYYERKFSNDEFRRPLVIIANSLTINQEIATCLNVVDFSLPNEVELTKVFDYVANNIEVDETRPGAVATYDNEMKSRTVQAMRGLTTLEAENIFCYGLRINRGFAPDLITTIENQKAVNIQKSEVLTYIPKDRITDMAQIGGYGELKDFIAVRKLAYTQKARDLKLDLPRGIVLVGIPGTGKSVVGKVIAKELGLPLVVINIAAVFGSLVGESERRIRNALNTIDALDGAVALVDEAEKALGGANEANGDSGVSRRVFGAILTWLTEKTSRTFVVMTMNRTRGLPAEFLRKGRFDEIFYTDIPTVEERDEILRIHCNKRSVDTAQYTKPEWEKLMAKTNNFVGAELEQLVCDARFTSFAARQVGQPTIDEFLIAASAIIPLIEAESENMAEIKKLCQDRARPVSKNQQIKVGSKKNRLVSV